MMTLSRTRNIVKQMLHKPPIIAHMSTIAKRNTVQHRSYNLDKPEVHSFYQC